MKRPRESQLNRNDEDLFSGWVTPFRQWNSCCSDRHRRQYHRNHRARIFGSCLITTLMVQVVVGLLLLLAINPAINASSEVDTMFTMNNKFEYNNHQQQQNNIRERRKQQQQQQQQQEHQRFLEDEEPKISPKAAADDFTLDLLSSSSDVECKSMGKCERCTFSEQKTYDSCKDTGRWEKFECTMAEALETSKSEDESEYDFV